MPNYFQPEIETASPEEIRKIQNEKIVKQVKHVYENVPYYKDLMDKKGVKPEDIKSVDDIKKLPFLTKADLREAYPYGLLGTDLKNCVRIQSTSGTTGKRVVAFYTQNDVNLWEDCCARAIVAAGGTKEDVCQIAYGYGLFTGGPGLNGGSHKVGCLTLPMSSGNTDRQIQFMMDLNATVLCCTPSYAAYIGETLAEKGYKPEDNNLKAGIFGAEPWTEEMRHEIEKLLGIKAYDIAFLNNMVFSWNSMNNFVVDRYTNGCRIALIIQEIRFAAKAADGLFSDFINLPCADSRFDCTFQFLMYFSKILSCLTHQLYFFC